MERMRGGKERWSPPPGGLPECRKRLHQECKVQGLSPAGRCWVVIQRDRQSRAAAGRAAVKQAVVWPPAVLPAKVYSCRSILASGVASLSLLMASSSLT